MQTLISERAASSNPYSDGLASDRGSCWLVALVEEYSGLLITGAGLIAYLPLLFRSLWVDEAGTFWTAHDGALAAIQRASHWPGQSILFAVISSLFCVNGSPLRDILLRVPALLGAALTCYFLFRLAEQAFGRGAGRIAAVLFAFSPPAIEFATQARPYTLAMAAATASCWLLYRWSRECRPATLFGYVIASTLVIYLHYLFAAIFFAHIALVLDETIERRSYRRLMQVAAAWASVAVLCIPITPHILRTIRESHSMVFVSRPGVQQLTDLLFPSLLGFGLLGSALFIGFFDSRVDRRVCTATSGLRCMLIVWWMAGPVLMFAISAGTSMQMFVPRYLSYSGPALALLLTYAAWSIAGPKAGMTWAILAAMISTGNPLTLAAARNSGPEELGPFIKLIRAESSDTKGELPPILFRSEFPESDFRDWRHEDASTSNLYAPFTAYPVRNTVIALPYRLNSDVKGYLARRIGADLGNYPKVLFVTHDPLWIPWIADQFEKAGFGYRWAQPNAFYVVSFERLAPQTEKGR